MHRLSITTFKCCWRRAEKLLKRYIIHVILYYVYNYMHWINLCREGKKPIITLYRLSSIQVWNGTVKTIALHGVSNSKRKRLSQPPKGHPANYIKVLFYTITPHVQRAAGVRVIGVCVHMHACMCADTKWAVWVNYN